MKGTQTLNFIKFASMVLAIGLSGRALASCGDSLSAMAAGAAASIQSQSSLMQQDSSKDNAEHASIVGLWYVRFMVGDQTIQDGVPDLECRRD